MAENLGELIVLASSIDELKETMAQASHHLGFRRFALSLEIGFSGESGKSILVHNYPSSWADVYQGFNLAATDPIRRAAERSLTGFRWNRVRDLIALTKQEEVMLATGYQHGLADGFTTPRHLPGEAIGSCTFVTAPGQEMPGPMLLVADTLGAAALEAARGFSGWAAPRERATLTDRQRDCVLWAARGKTNWEISQILGITEATVIQHLKDARERYDVSKKASLILCALFDGLISFTDIFRWRFLR